MVRMTNPKPRVTEQDVVQAEKTLKLAFPPNYRAFLLEHNGGSPIKASFGRSSVHVFFGIDAVPRPPSLEQSMRNMGSYLPSDTVPIAQVASDVSNLFLSSISSGAVLFFDSMAAGEEDDYAPSP